MITREIIELTREWLGDEGITAFTKIVLGSDLIYFHFTAGMDVRNFLRDTTLCKNWNPHDFDNNWQKIIMKAIAEDYTEEELINDRDS